MTNNGLLTKKEALEKIEDILKTFDEEVYEKLNRANINDEKIKALTDSLIESAKKSSDEKFSYKDVSVIFNGFKKLAEDYKLSWLNKPSAENRKIENKKLRLLNLGAGLSELNFENSDDIQYIKKLENEEFKELLDLTPEKDRIIFSKKRTGIYLGHDKSYVDICSTIDEEVQALALFLGIPLQESLSDGLNTLGDFCPEYNKIFFFGLPWLIGKGLKKGGEVLSEIDIPSLTNNIVFTKKVLDSLCDTYFAENEKFKKNLINDSIKELTTDEQSEIKKFIKSDDYESFKNEILFKVNIDELQKSDLPGYFYNEEKKKFDIKVPGVTPGNLLKLNLLKDGGFVNYGLNLFKDNILEIDLGTNLGNGFRIGNLFDVNLGNKDKTAKEFSVLLTALEGFSLQEYQNNLRNALKETNAQASDFLSIGKGNTDIVFGATVGTDGVTEKLGVMNVLFENEDTKVTLMNTATAKQGWDGIPKGLDFKTDVYSSTINSTFKFSSDSKKNSFITSFGFSLCLSELQNKPCIISKDALLNFGITYSKPDISKDDNHVSIKTTLNVGDSKTDFNLGFQIDTASCVNSKMIITFSLKGL